MQAISYLCRMETHKSCEGMRRQNSQVKKCECDCHDAEGKSDG